VEVQRVVQILGRKTKSNPVLLGEPGVGKTAVAEGIASAIVAGALPDGSPLPPFLVRLSVGRHDSCEVHETSLMWDIFAGALPDRSPPSLVRLRLGSDVIKYSCKEKLPACCLTFTAVAPNVTDVLLDPSRSKTDASGQNVLPCKPDCHRRIPSGITQT